MKKFKNILKTTTVSVIVTTTLVSSSPVLALSNSTYIPAKQQCEYVSNLSEGIKYALRETSKKKYKLTDINEILGEIIGKDSEYIKEQVKNGKTLENIADEYGVLDRYKEAALEIRNLKLEDLFLKGRISEKEYMDMYNDTEFSAIPMYEKLQRDKKIKNAGENIAELLASVLNQNVTDVENEICSGKSPWEIANSAGKLGELKEVVLESIISHLDDMVSNGEISREDADERIADFELDFPQFE